MTDAQGAPAAERRRAVPIMVDIEIEAGDWPAAAALRKLAESAVDAAAAELDWPSDRKAEVSLLFTDDNRISELNSTWRGRSGPTNVLSFPAGFSPDADDGTELLGDIALACQTVRREANIDSKPFDHHLMHLIVHGFLHLCGYDHLNDEEAEEMESLEIGALARLDVPDPYAVTQSLQDWAD